MFVFSPCFPCIDASTIETSEEIEIAYPITCGESKAILLWKKFVCPGINVKCVKVTAWHRDLSQDGLGFSWHLFFGVVLFSLFHCNVHKMVLFGVGRNKETIGAEGKESYPIYM